MGVVFIAMLLSSLGATWIAMYGTIFDRGRAWITSRSPFVKELLSCAMCTGTWTGIAHAVIMTGWLTTHNITGLIWLMVIAFPFASAAFCFVGELLVDVISDLQLRIKSNTSVDK